MYVLVDVTNVSVTSVPAHCTVNVPIVGFFMSVDKPGGQDGTDTVMTVVPDLLGCSIKIVPPLMSGTQKTHAPLCPIVKQPGVAACTDGRVLTCSSAALSSNAPIAENMILLFDNFLRFIIYVFAETH